MKKNRLRIILFALLIAILAAAAVLLIWQRDNVGAAYTALTSDASAIKKEWSDHRQAQQEFLDDHEVAVTPPTPEQNDDLFNHRVTPQEVKEELGLIEPPKQEPEPEAAEPPLPPTAEELIDECTRSLYCFRIDLMARLGDLMADAVAQWESLPPEAHDQSHKSEIVLDGIHKCVDLECELDERVSALLDDYREKLTAIGADLSVMDQLWIFYCEDKKTTKAYYFNQYL